MYWLIGSLIIIAMMGVLAVADSLLMPIDPSLLGIFSAPVLSLLLTTIAITLFVIKQFNIPTVSTSNTPQNFFSYLPRPFEHSFRIVSYLLIAILAMALVIGSALQAMVSHQQAEAAEITEPMRVQALVTVEGISDSVYDAATSSGYRQVATISHISPLVTKLAPQDLEDITVHYLENNSNSLSKSTVYDNKHENKHDNKYENNSDISNGNDKQYRVLLNAYPKQSSSGEPSNHSPLTRLNHLQPGDRLFMSLTLAPLATSEQVTNNPSGFDSYRWLRGRHIDGVANILAISPSIVTGANSSAASSNAYLQRFRTRIDQGRWQLRQHFYTDWAGQTTANQQAKAVTLSLLTGDRSLINRDTKDLYQLAGISHLLAISGTHILFLAIMLSGAVVLIFNRLCPMVYRYVPRWQVRWWVMVGAAFIYALFTGFDVPAARTAWMLLAIGLVRLTLLPISTMRVLFALAILMAWRDPYVLWQAGYWLSFIAVALLLQYDDRSYQNDQSAIISSSAYIQRTNTVNAFFKRVWIFCKRLFKLQFWLFITLLPITLLLFGKASLWGLVINLFAIGLFGWVIVPLNLLAGLCYLLSPAIGDSIWTLVIAIVASLHELIIWLTSLPALSKAWLYTPVNVAILLIVLLSILPWLLPRGFISRWLALPPLTLLMMTVYANQQSLATIPTLYILPTGDRYVSAVLLQYPITDDKKNVSWLFLADHRPTASRTIPSSLTADKLSMTLEQQLGTLSVGTLEGIMVQSSSVGLTATLTNDNNGNKRNGSNSSASELLPTTVAQLSQRLPVSQYWQAGRSDRWPDIQRTYKVASQSNNRLDISVQRCDQGKTWQLPNGDLTIQAMTGWSKIDDASVWDCSVAIDSRLSIRVLKYNANDPMRSLPASAQTLSQTFPQTLNSQPQSTSHQTHESASRIILNADTHQHIWQMWSLLCSAETLNDKNISNHTTWLGHSASHITADVISHQKVNEIITYDDKGLEAALSLNTIVDSIDTAP